MIVDELMRMIWKNNSDGYNQQMNIAYKKKALDIYIKILHLLNNYNNDTDFGIGFLPINIETIGCQHCHKIDGFHGCSMCNWASSDIMLHAYMEALKRKDIRLYSKLILYQIFKQRKRGKVSKIAEEYIVQNAFDEDQFPQNLIEEIKSKYKSTPAIGLIQVRADSITQEKIKIWKKLYSKILNISLGIEVSNEWIRNHILNKKLDNLCIKEKLQLLKANNCITNTNVILGIPSFDYISSLHVFIDTVKELFYNSNVDIITISPLINKEYTLQSIFSEHLRIESLSVEGFFIALYLIVNEIPNVGSKLVISPENFKTFMEVNHTTILSPIEVGICNFIKSIMSMGTYKKVSRILEMSDTFELLNGNDYRYKLKKHEFGNDFKNELIANFCFIAKKVHVNEREISKIKDEIFIFKYNKKLF